MFVAEAGRPSRDAGPFDPLRGATGRSPQHLPYPRKALGAQLFTFRVHSERLAIARLPADAPVPAWASGAFASVTRTPSELSIVCAEALVPADVLHERGRIALGIEGTLAMTTIGILAALCGALAHASVPVFVLSTYDTDWLLVPAERFDAACGALRSSGHRIVGTMPEA